MNRIEQNYDALIEDEVFTPEVSVGGITGAEPEAVPGAGEGAGPLSMEAATSFGQDVARFGKGSVTGTVGGLGDLVAIGRGLYEIGRRGGDESVVDAFTRGFQSRTILPTTEDVNNWLDANVPLPEFMKGKADVPQTIGEVASIGGLVKKAVPSIVKATKDIPVGMQVKPVTEAEAANMLAAKQGTEAAAPVAEGVVSTRFPTAKKATENPLEQNLVIGLDVAKADPVAFAHNVGMVSKYPNFVSKATTPDAQAEDFITHVKDNLLFLHDAVPEATRVRSKLWYDGARNIATRYASEYNIPDSGVAGIMAALSPQMDWFRNVSLGTRVLEIMSKQQSHVWDAAMTKTASRIWADPKYAPILKDIQGKSLNQLTDVGQKSLWLRTFDETYLPREHQVVSPEGDFIRVRTNADGKPAGTGWGSNNEIAKAIAIFDNPTIQNISTNLGTQHKVRNFYNNIFAPNDPGGHVTIDTHAVAAGLLRPFSGESREVKHNFGQGLKGEGGTKNSSVTGVKGTYPLYAEAYRRAAAERGILPREMQSITWEAVRGLFPDTYKKPENAAQIDNIWLKYREGKISLEEARNEVTTAAGGINPPEWERPGLHGGSAAKVQPAGDQGELPGAGVPGRRAGRPRRVKPAGGNQAGVNTQQGGTE